MILNGTYRFNESVNLNGSYIEANVAFTSKGTTYSKMLFNSGMLELIYDTTQVYVGLGSGWIDEAYREVSFRNQTVNDDFYSWFMENAEFVKDNEPLTLNGTYVFNETVNYPYDYPSFFGFEYYVPFYCNGILCSGMNFGSTGMEEIDFIGLGLAYQGIGMGWQNGAYKKVTFDNQAVSDDFYNWLTENSSPAKTLDGAYKFNESVNANDFVEYVTFISKGGTYSEMSFYGGMIDLYYYGTRAFSAIEIGGWADEAYRTVIFDNQAVSEAFYNFIASNATPTEAPLLNGIYTFNEVVWVGEVIDEFVTFTSNGRTFSKMGVYGFPEICYDETLVYQGLGMGDWTILDEAYRTVTFDNQLVSETLYNFIASNATLDKTVYTIEKFTLKKIADAIREKKGTTADIPVSRLGNEIRKI